jgi:hypothetical protein
MIVGDANYLVNASSNNNKFIMKDLNDLNVEELSNHQKSSICGGDHWSSEFWDLAYHGNWLGAFNSIGLGVR